MAYRAKNKRKNTTGEEVADTTARPQDVHTPVEPTVVGDKGYPRWANWVYVKWGYLVGVLIFAVFLLFAWPLGLALAAAAVSWIATQFVGSLPESVAGEMGWNAPIVMPVIFLVIVAALLVAWILQVCIRFGFTYSRRVALGLFAGHGEGLRANMARRKAGAKDRRSEVKRIRAERKAAKKKAKQQVSQARESNEEL